MGPRTRSLSRLAAEAGIRTLCPKPSRKAGKGQGRRNSFSCQHFHRRALGKLDRRRGDNLGSLCGDPKLRGCLELRSCSPGTDGSRRARNSHLAARQVAPLHESELSRNARMPQFFALRAVPKLPKQYLFPPSRKFIAQHEFCYRSNSAPLPRRKLLVPVKSNLHYGNLRTHRRARAPVFAPDL